MRVSVISVLVLIAGTLTAAEPRVETFPVPEGHLPTEIARHGDAMAFVTWRNWPAIEPYLGHIDQKGRIRLDALAKDHMPGLMSQSSDGTLWMSDGKKSVLWRVSPRGKAEQVTVGRTTLGVAAAPDGSIWVSHPEGADVTRYGPKGEVRSQWFVGRRHGRPAAPSLSIPKPRLGPPQIDRNKKNDRSLTKEERKKLRLDSRPTWMTIGPDGALWFTEPTWRSIGRVTEAGKTQSFDFPREWGEPRRIAAGRDGALWFALTNAYALGRITVEGEITTVELPYIAGIVAADSEGRIWFADLSGSEVGYLDRAGKVTPIALPKAPRKIRSMAEGPDGAMWFADQAARAIGRITVGR